MGCPSEARFSSLSYKVKEYGGRLGAELLIDAEIGQRAHSASKKSGRERGARALELLSSAKREQMCSL